MLSNTEVESLTVLLAARNGAKGISKEAINQAWETVQAALVASATARATMGAAAVARQAANPNRAKGRPPTQWYAVEFGSLWRVNCLGGQAALALVNEELTNHKQPLAKAASLAVALSSKGQWWRAVETDNGRHDLSVRKVNAPK